MLREPILLVRQHEHNLKMAYMCFQLYEFHKKLIPEDSSEKEDMAEKLMAFNISLRDYQKSLEYAFLVVSYTFVLPLCFWLQNAHLIACMQV